MAGKRHCQADLCSLSSFGHTKRIRYMSLRQDQPEIHVAPDYSASATILHHAPRRARMFLAAALLAATALTGYGIEHVTQAEELTKSVPAAAPIGDFSALVQHVRPAVVSITVKMVPRQVAQEMPGGVPLPFGMPGAGPGAEEGGQPAPRMAEARGSGFIIDANGTIVTNNHVVKDAKTVSVTLDDGTELPATIVGRDPRTDLAVLKVSAGHPLPYIELGDSDHVLPGQWVVAVGNPFGLGGTVTAGIVSARGRDIGSGPYDDYIQVDAPINQGNSGGPLFSQDGKVIGVNTAIFSPTGGSVGIGFAIPSSIVRNVVSQLESGGKVTRGFIGVTAQQVDKDMAAALNLPLAKEGSPKGALISSIEENSPAAKASLRPGDVVQTVNGQVVGSPRDLALKVSSLKPGSHATLSVVHDGTARDVTVTIGAMPSTETASLQSGTGAESGQGRIGVALQPLTPELRNELEIPAEIKGAVIANVQPGSAAEQAGIKAGDVLVGVNTTSVTSPSQAASAIHAASKRNTVALRILRNGQIGFVGVTLKSDTNDG
ncbi:Endopeptidase degP [Granulibacter bethesdensis]|nr:Endopeptidase degP [Granulibacter bethesdensis]